MTSINSERATAGDYVAGGKPLTGRRVLFIFLTFIATFVTVDLFMWRMAATSFSGLVSNASFREGVKYDEELRAARAQTERGWRVEAHVAAAPAGRSRVELSAVDRDGKPLAGLTATAKFSHRTDLRHDVSVDLKEASPGVYVGEGDPIPGAYTLILDLGRDGQRLFMSRNRTTIGS